MISVVVGVTLLIVGAIAGRAGRKIGTTLAGLLVLAWIGLISWLGVAGGLDGPAVQSLAAYLVIGLLAFLLGSHLTGRRSSVRRNE